MWVRLFRIKSTAHIILPDAQHVRPSVFSHPNPLFTSSLLTHRLYAQQELSDGKFTRTGGANNECRMSPHVRGG